MWSKIMALLGLGRKKEYTPPEVEERRIDTSPRDTRPLEAYSGELSHRLRALEIEAEIIGRRNSKAAGRGTK